MRNLIGLLQFFLNRTKWVLGGHHRAKLGFLKKKLFEKIPNICLQLLAKF